MSAILVWLAFLSFPLAIGVLMVKVNRTGWKAQYKAAVQTALGTVLLLGLLLGFVWINALVGRVALFEFVAGCLVGTGVLWKTSGRFGPGP
ncbi:hypothetical protein [uncultured Tateyamaria sp.]|uniref:hypothetical protein n=1 Tax=uncultured Tateyamaria sp. TaxID=455651 RepID=UPI00262D6684|nr:hypothetical protein [uncultured Tateyamaria sp.]